VAEPTAKQRRMYARMGIAMPDGSYYIRNADDLQNAIESVGRATPNAGESDVARRNAVRRHIIQRASALKLSSKIPDTWASDGSLKQPTASHEAVGQAFIAHFGRKGMKWGEHVFGGPDGGSSRPAGAAKPSRGDAKWEKGAQGFKNMSAIHNASVKAMNADLERINNQPRFKNADFTTHTALRRAYYDEIQKSMNQRYNEAAGQMRNPSGTRHLRVDVKIFNSGEIENHLYPVDLKHADGAGMTFKTQLKTDAKGRVLSIELPEVSHEALGQEFIAHFGRKGMKWGEHRFGRDRGSGSATVHPDVARARAAQEIIRTHGISALSNEHLRDLNKRTQLETDYARLNSHTSEGRKIVEGFAKQQGTQLASHYVTKYAPKGIEWVVRNGIKIAVGSGRHTKF